MRFDSLPILKTERLLLRPVTQNDVPAVFAYASDPEVSKLLSWEPATSLDQTKEIVRQWLDNYQHNKQAPWGVVDKESGTVIGTVDVRNYNIEKRSAELGYCLSRAFWGKGLMAEAINAVIEYLFTEADLTEIVAFVRADNPQSQRVLEKIGMHKVQSNAKQEYVKGNWINFDRWILCKKNQ